jgi:hypothetical protein
MSNWLESILSRGPVARIRRNHGLEHATLHLLARRFPGRSAAGYSDPGGFWIVGEIPTETLRTIVHEALHRLRNGEHGLAIHPHCGTNFVTSGTLAGVAAALSMLGAGPSWREKLERLSLAAFVATLALIIAQPLGYSLQANVTTLGAPGGLEITQIIPSSRGGVQMHRIVTRG